MLSSEITHEQEEGLQRVAKIVGHRFHEDRYEYLVTVPALFIDDGTWKVEESLVACKRFWMNISGRIDSKIQVQAKNMIPFPPNSVPLLPRRHSLTFHSKSAI